MTVMFSFYFHISTLQEQIVYKRQYVSCAHSYFVQDLQKGFAYHHGFRIAIYVEAVLAVPWFSIDGHGPTSVSFY